MGMTTLDYDEKTIKLINSFIIEKFKKFGLSKKKDPSTKITKVA